VPHAHWKRTGASVGDDLSCGVIQTAAPRTERPACNAGTRAAPHGRPVHRVDADAFRMRLRWSWGSSMGAYSRGGRFRPGQMYPIRTSHQAAWLIRRAADARRISNPAAHPTGGPDRSAAPVTGHVGRRGEGSERRPDQSAGPRRPAASARSGRPECRSASRWTPRPGDVWQNQLSSPGPETCGATTGSPSGAVTIWA